MTFENPRSRLSESQNWDAIEQIIERAYRVRPAEMLIGLWQGGNVNAPGLIIGWDSALANSQAVQATGKDQSIGPLIVSMPGPMSWRIAMT